MIESKKGMRDTMKHKVMTKKNKKQMIQIQQGEEILIRE